jgi:transcriptional regulator
MHVPAPFAMEDRPVLFSLAASHPFATVVTRGEADGDDDVIVSHLPLLVDEGRGVLRGHLARENPQLAHLTAGVRVLAVFHGPHAYVSPSVYAPPEEGRVHVPTWNYVVVHARGRARRLDAEGLRTLLEDMVERFEPTGWRVPPIGEGSQSLQALLDAIVGFEIAVERIQGKWKLSQNRSPEDRARVAAWLGQRDPLSRAVAGVMRFESGTTK